MLCAVVCLCVFFRIGLLRGCVVVVKSEGRRYVSGYGPPAFIVVVRLARHLPRTSCRTTTVPWQCAGVGW